MRLTRTRERASSRAISSARSHQGAAGAVLVASLLALLCYPFLIEPWLPLQVQSSAWSFIFACFAMLCIASGFALTRHAIATVDRVIAGATLDEVVGTVAVQGVVVR